MKICLCGSTKFIDQFHSWNKWLSLNGHVVYSVATSTKGDFIPTTGQKIVLDLVPLRKVQESDAVFVIDLSRDPGMSLNALEAVKGKLEPYIGFSTAREIAWACMQDIPVMYVSKLPNEWHAVSEHAACWLEGNKKLQEALAKGM